MKIRLYLTVLMASLFLTSSCKQKKDRLTNNIKAENKKPNIIFMLADDLRADTVGFMGNYEVHTPNLDGLAKKGTVFNNAYVTTSICAVSRASILTGQYARKHNIWGFSKDLSPDQIQQSYPILLKNNGYNIGFIGKYGVGHNPPKSLFNYWKGFNGQGTYKQTDKNGKDIHLTSKIGNQAEEFLNESKNLDQPFCLSISFKAPHVEGDPGFFLADENYGALHNSERVSVPITANQKYFDHFPDEFTENNVARNRWKSRFSNDSIQQENIKKYYRLIAGIDEVVGRIMNKLKKNGQDKNTIIIFSSDNGFYLGEYGFAGKWYGSEPSIRVPLLIADLRKKQSDIKLRNEMVLNIDIAPTILDYAISSIAEYMQGKSLRPLVNNEATSWRDHFFYEHLWQSSEAYYIPSTEGVVYKDKKYMKYFLNRDTTNIIYEELYMLKDDPYEIRNLIGSSDFYDLKKELKNDLETTKQSVNK